MMEHARRVVSNDPAPPVESVAEGGKKIAGEPKRGEHKRKRVNTDERGAQLERKKARQTQIASTIRRGSAATDTAVAAGPAIKTKTSSKKGRLQKPHKIGVAAEQNIFSSSQLGQGKGVERQTSTYRGVSLFKRTNKWKGDIRYDGKKHHLGYFEDEEAAARAYDRAVRTKLGEKAQLNFPTKNEQAAKEAKQQRWIKFEEAPSQYRGVCWIKSKKKWRAAIKYGSKPHSLGYFEDEEEAARAYDKAVRAQHGEKAQAQRFRMQLNFPTKKEQAAEEAKQQQWIKFGEAGSKYRGVSWNKRCNKWLARIKHDGKLLHLGYFEDEAEAARAYDRAAKVHKEAGRAQLNFPTKQRN
jgi:hypothetical protein